MMTERGHLESCPFCRGNRLELVAVQAVDGSWAGEIHCKCCNITVRAEEHAGSGEDAVKVIMAAWNKKPDPL